MAFLAGESGVGKTRLLLELERRAREGGTLVLAGDSIAFGGECELPYAPLVAALRPLARSADPALTEPVRAAVAPLLPGLGAQELDPPPDADPGAQARLFEGLLALLDGLGRRQPVLLIVEDLHWADRSTRAALAFLARSLIAERVLVVASYRPDELARRHPLRPWLAELERDLRTRRISLEPLTRDELAQQLTDILGGRARRRRAGAVVDALGRQSAVRRGAAGRRDRRARRGAGDAARRADAARGAAVRACAGAAAARRGRPARSTIGCCRRRAASSRRRCATRCVTPSRATSWSPRTTARTGSATRSCARCSTISCCPASGPTCT